MDNPKRLSPLDKLLLVTETDPKEVESLTIDEVHKELQSMEIDIRSLTESGGVLNVEIRRTRIPTRLCFNGEKTL